MAGRERLFFGYVAVVGVAALSLSAPFLADLPGFLVHAPRARERPGVVAEEALAMGAVLLLGVLAVYASALVLVPLYVASRMARLAAQRHRYLRLDPLTGLLGRPALAAEVAARARAGERFALFLLDLDRFRRVNSALGHAAGDRLLAAVGRRLRATALPGEVVARLGGDEF